MTVVVDQRQALPREPAGAGREPTAHTAKAFEARDNAVVRNALLGGHRNRRQRILDVVASGQRQRYAQRFPVRAQRREGPWPVPADDFHGAIVDTLGETVAARRTADSTENARGESIIPAHHGQAVEGQTLGEFDERIKQTPEVLVVGVQVVAVDVRDDRHKRCEVQKRRIGLVGFGDQVLSRPKPGIAAVGQRRPDGVGRIQALRPGTRSPASWPWWSCHGFRRRRCPGVGASTRRASRRVPPPGFPADALPRLPRCRRPPRSTRRPRRHRQSPGRPWPCRTEAPRAANRAVAPDRCTSDPVTA